MEKTKLVVINEHTLGYIMPETPNYAGILHTSVLRGSYYNGMGGPIYIKNENVRLDTKKDFDDYRVVFSGYEKHPELYEFQE